MKYDWKKLAFRTVITGIVFLFLNQLVRSTDPWAGFIVFWMAVESSYFFGRYAALDEIKQKTNEKMKKAGFSADYIKEIDGEVDPELVAEVITKYNVQRHNN